MICSSTPSTCKYDACRLNRVFLSSDIDLKRLFCNVNTSHFIHQCLHKRATYLYSPNHPPIRSNYFSDSIVPDLLKVIIEQAADFPLIEESSISVSGQCFPSLKLLKHFHHFFFILSLNSIA